MISSGFRRPPLLWATKIIQIFFYFASKIIFCRVRLEVRGAHYLENIHGSAIFAANHASEIDPFALCFALEKAGVLRKELPLIFLSREKSYYSDMGMIKAFLYGGFLFRLIGAYPVTPKKERAQEDAHTSTLKTHIALLQHGYSVCMFPEGTRTVTGKLLPAKPGVAVLSLRSGRPIVPIAIDSTFHISFSDFFLGKKSIRVFFGEPIPSFKNYDAMMYFISLFPFLQKRAVRVRAQLVMQRIKTMLENV